MNATLIAIGGLQTLVQAPVWSILILKLTAILAIAWSAYFMLKQVNPRWRILIWRAAASGLILLFVATWMFPTFKLRILRPLPVEEAVSVASHMAGNVEKATTVSDLAGASRLGPGGAMLDPFSFPGKRFGHFPGSRPGHLKEDAALAAQTKPPAPTVALDSSAANAPLPVSKTPKPASSILHAWPRILLVVWLVGIVFFGLRLLLGHLCISALVRRAKPAAPKIVDEYRRVNRSIGCRREVEVLQSADVVSPFLFGVRRPRLLLPEKMSEASYRRDIPGILAHELTHVRHNDIAWNILLQLLSIVLWFHPLTWRMRKAHLASCELVCDAASAEFVGDVSDYCRILARVAVDACGRLPSTGMAMARTSAIIHRLHVLQKQVFGTPLRRRSVITFGLATLLSAAMLGVLQLAFAEKEEKAADLSTSTTAVKSLGPFTVKLPDEGPTIEILGVCDHFPKDEENKKYKDKRWWKPDGTPVEEPLYKLADLSGRSCSYPLDNQIARELVCRISPPQSEDTWTSFSVKGTSASAGGGSAGKIRKLSLTIDRAKQDLTARVDYAQGPWTVNHSLPPGGSSKVSGPGVGDTTLVFTPASELKGSAVLTLTHEMLDRQVRIVAIDQDGKRHGSGESDAMGLDDKHSMLTAKFTGLPLSKVTAFRVESRPTKWVEWRNIAVHPGQKSKIEIVTSEGPVPAEQSPSSSETATASSAKAKESAPDKTKPKKPKETAKKPQRFTITILGPDGKPLAERKIRFCVNPPIKGGEPMPGVGWWKAYHMRTTDAEGKISVTVPDITKLKNFEVCPRVPGYALHYLRWNKKNLPVEHTIKLDKAAAPLGGIVLDPDDKPIVGAEIEFFLPLKNRSNTPVPLPSCMFRGYSDDAGRWTCEYIPVESLKDVKEINLSIDHPDRRSWQDFHVPIAKLKSDASGKYHHTAIMQEVARVSGQVVDPAGKPVEGAVITGCNANGLSKDCKVKTDADGRFSFAHRAKEGRYLVFATHDDFGPAMKVASTEGEPKPLTLDLSEKETMQFRVVDENGKPIQGAYILDAVWRGEREANRGCFPKRNPKTDAEGRLVWKNAPKGEEIQFDIRSKNHLSIEKTVKADGGENVLIMPSAFRMKATVLDDETGKPIPSFRVFRAYVRKPFRLPVREWIEWNAIAGRNGTFEAKETYGHPDGYRFKIEADGYEPLISDVFEKTSKPDSQVFRLKKAGTTPVESPSNLTGIILTPDGKPAAGATIAYAQTATHRTVSLRENIGGRLGTSVQYGGRLGPLENVKDEEIHTDEKGRFRLPKLKANGKHLLAVSHKTGITVVTYKEFPKLWDIVGDKNLAGGDAGPTLRLTKWGTVEGVALIGDTPAKNVAITLGRYEFVWKTQIDRKDREKDYEHLTTIGPFNIRTDNQGRFTIDRLPPGTYSFGRRVDYNSTMRFNTSFDMSHLQEVKVDPGKVAKIQIGGTGRPVRGTLKSPAGYDGPVDWKAAYVRITRTIDYSGFAALPKRPEMPKEINIKARDEVRKKIEKEMLKKAKEDPNGKIVTRGYRLDEMVETQAVRDWMSQTEAGRKYKVAYDKYQTALDAYNQKKSKLQHTFWSAAVNEDGTFEVPDVPSGRLTLHAQLNKPRAEAGRWISIGAVAKKITLPAIEGPRSDEPFDVGTLQMIDPTTLYNRQAAEKMKQLNPSWKSATPTSKEPKTKTLPQEKPVKPAASPANKTATSDASSPEETDKLAAALVKGVYDSQAWLDRAESFLIRSTMKVVHTEEEQQWREKHPRPGMFGMGSGVNPEPFVSENEWAWDKDRVRHHTGTSPKDAGTSHRAFRQTKIWDGKQAIEIGKSAGNEHYVLGNKLTPFFDKMHVGMQELPWWPGGKHDLWWVPDDVDESRAIEFITPEDFKLIGEETIDGRRCHVVQSKAGHSRLYIGVDDGRLYRRTTLVLSSKSKGYDPLKIYRKIGGPSIKTVHHWSPWVKNHTPEKQSEIWRQEKLAEFEYTRVWSHQNFHDYREVAPGCWLPFSQTAECYNLEDDKPFVFLRNEQTVTEVKVNEPLDDQLFQYTLTDGARVSTDYRYDPWISYTYSKDQTEEDRLALCEAKRAEQKQSKKDWEKRYETLESRKGQTPPALPGSDWIHSDPLSWKDLKGKVVRLHFWAVSCGPCRNEMALLAGSGKYDPESDLVTIGVHPYTKDPEAVRKKLTDLGVDYPVLIDAPPTKPGKLGQLHDWLGVRWWPHTVLIDQKGRVAGHGHLLGGNIHEQVDQLLAPNTTASKRKPSADKKAKPASSPAVKPASPPPTDKKASTPAKETMRVHVLDEAGKPIEGAKLNARYRGGKTAGVTDKLGKVNLKLPAANKGYIYLYAKVDGFVQLRKHWVNQDNRDPRPEAFTFTFEEGRTIGGVVHDVQGKPIQGVKVRLGLSPMNYAKKGIAMALWDKDFLTDAEGRWHLDHVPEKIGSMAIRLQHPDYISGVHCHSISANEQKEIKQRTSIQVMKRGIGVAGTVTGPDGTPVVDAVVTEGTDGFGASLPQTRTDQKGQYRFNSLEPGNRVLTVISPGLAPALKNVIVKPDMKPVDFKLEKGHTLQIRVVGKDQKPIGGAYVSVDTWRGYRTLGELKSIPKRTDAEGRWTWNWAPKDAAEIRISRGGYMGSGKLSMKPQEEAHLVTLYPVLKISGRVIDAETKQPILHFLARQGYIPGGSNEYRRISWDRFQKPVEGKNGQYQLSPTCKDCSEHYIRIEAAGYLPKVSRTIKRDEGNVQCDFALTKGKPMDVTVRLPDGKPAVGAEARIRLEPPDGYCNMAMFIQGGQFQYEENDQTSIKLKVDARGRLRIEPQDGDFVMVVIHDQGIAQATSQELKAKPEIQLAAWARLEGVVQNGSAPVPDVKIDAYPHESSGQRWSFLNFHERWHKTDAEGKFILPKLKPGKWSVRQLSDGKEDLKQQQWKTKIVELEPGQTTKVTLGGSGEDEGRTVIGQIQWPGGKLPEGDLSKVWGNIRPYRPDPPAPPADVLKQSPDAIRAWRAAWYETEEGKAWKAKASCCSRLATVDKDNHLRVEKMTPGKYELSVYVTLREDHFPWERPESLRYKAIVSVPESSGPANNQPLDLGTIPLTDESPKKISLDSVTPPADMPEGEKQVGGMKDHLELLRYVMYTYTQNKAKIQTWQGRATVENHQIYGKEKTGIAYSADVRFLFDRKQKSFRWNTTLGKYARIAKGRERELAVPQIINGMMTPEGLYRFGGFDSPGNPANRPLTLLIYSLTGPQSRLQPQNYDFNPMYFLDTSRGDVAKGIAPYLGWIDKSIGSIKVIREGDHVTVDHGNGEHFNRYTLSLSQGCNPIYYESGGTPDSNWKYRWTYEQVDGVWLPKTWTETIHQKDSRDKQRTITFTEHHLNRPVKTSAFSLPALEIKTGDTVQDRRTEPMNRYQYQMAL